jgi:hypothetical protein
VKLYLERLEKSPNPLALAPNPEALHIYFGNLAQIRPVLIANRNLASFTHPALFASDS